ncbi:XkdQ/YqbQ family protein [Lacticaseibacillus saniviri]|uniref:YqbQ/XkdQ domain-containing protein n=1 Tax=Lacticaseibacillus saniviri JCM 17471 = DSM 24301 TaxID=1293598 RepID=A0A0R2MSY4_9LACO|nr:hypothetical protein [Lacticaseibacillus saniviri]KRO16625.1 hypothetical protein IV56_GL001069 [Lacticaseibacillus saniviri JCM 17471 = DSM 24301]
MAELTTLSVNSRGSSQQWDIKSLATNMSYVKDSNFAAGELTFDVLEVNEGWTPQNGDEVHMSWDGVKVFFGYIFKIGYSGDEKFSITAYDKLRYLKNQDSIVWPAGTVSQRFSTVCNLAGITSRVVSSSSHKLSAKVADGVSYFDMMQDDIKETKSATGQQFFIRDNYGVVELAKMPVKKTDLLIGDGSLLTDWSYDRSIDDAANVVKVVKNSKKDQGKSTSTATDSASEAKNTVLTSQSSVGGTTARWGRLQVVEKVSDDKMNAAAMKAKANQILAEKNKETRSLKITALGTLEIDVGDSFWLSVNSLADIGVGKRQVTVTKVTHKFDPKNWTMDLEVQV